MAACWTELQRLAGNSLPKALRSKPRSESDFSDPSRMISGNTNLIMSHPSLNFFCNSSVSKKKSPNPITKSYEALHVMNMLPYYILLPTIRKSALQPFQICPMLCPCFFLLFLHIFPTWFVCVFSSPRLTILQTSIHQIQP